MQSQDKITKQKKEMKWVGLGTRSGQGPKLRDKEKKKIQAHLGLDQITYAYMDPKERTTQKE